MEWACRKIFNVFKDSPSGLDVGRETRRGRENDGVDRIDHFNFCNHISGCCSNKLTDDRMFNSNIKKRL